MRINRREMLAGTAAVAGGLLVGSKVVVAKPTPLATFQIHGISLCNVPDFIGSRLTGTWQIWHNNLQTRNLPIYRFPFDKPNVQERKPIKH